MIQPFKAGQYTCGLKNPFEDDKIASTVSNNRLYIAFGTKCVGSINSYNNFFTRLFAMITFQSIKIDFGDEISHEFQYVNKNEYKRLLGRFIGRESVGPVEFNIEDYRRISFLNEKIKKMGGTEISGQYYMRDVISKKDSEKITHEFEQAIMEQDERKIEQMVRIGARVNRLFHAGSVGPQKNSYNSHLGPCPHQFFVTYAPPVMHLKLAGLENMFNLLKEFGANTKYVKGERFMYVREFKDASENGKVDVSPSFESGLLVSVFSASRDWSRTFEDRKEDICKLSFDGKGALLVEPVIPVRSKEDSKAGDDANDDSL